MRKVRVNTMDGGEKSVNVTRVGLVVWNSVTGDLKIEGEEGYMPATKAVASLMLVADHVVNLAVARAEVYPVYGNENAVTVCLTMVSVNAGTVMAHYPDAMRRVLEALGEKAERLGLLDIPSDESQQVLEFPVKEKAP